MDHLVDAGVQRTPHIDREPCDRWAHFAGVCIRGP
jgi:hypothetical protein